MLTVAATLLVLFQTADAPVEQTKKNIKVLQGTPSSQLIPIMAFMANSLGVTCSHCHSTAYETDDKPAKEAARRMITLQRDLNARYYDGKPVVTCNTCHRGSIATTATPELARAGWNHPTPPPVPPATVAGDEAVARLAKSEAKHRVVRGTVERYNGRSEPVSEPFTLTLDGDATKYDTKLSHPPEASRALLIYLVTLPPPERLRAERWTFDDKNLLVRRARETATPLGTLPEQIDYSDYRSGLPYRAQWSRADYRVTFTVTQIE